MGSDLGGSGTLASGGRAAGNGVTGAGLLAGQERTTTAMSSAFTVSDAIRIASLRFILATVSCGGAPRRARRVRQWCCRAVWHDWQSNCPHSDFTFRVKRVGSPTRHLPPTPAPLRLVPFVSWW